MKPSLRAKLTLLLISVFFGLAALEIGVRLLTRRDADGNLWFFSTHLKPYRVPVQHAEAALRRYLTEPGSVIAYDADLGWVERAAAHGQNAQGFLSTAAQVPHEAPADKLRIAIFGGSYARGSYANEPGQQGWWRTVEEDLNAAGVPCEVLNFGVGGYGMDQALLRWRRDGQPFHPHLVLFGFNAGNSYENLNLIRMVKDPDSGIPFTKPRFLLEGEKLRLINSPTPSPEQALAIMHDVGAWPLSAQDRYWVPADFSPAWWRSSRVLALAEAKAGARARKADPEAFYKINDEPARLALAITRELQREVEETGASFVVAHLPHSLELEAFEKRGRFPYDEMYTALKSSTAVISPEAQMLALALGKNSAAFFHDGHYVAEMETTVGHAIAAALRERAAALRKP